MKFLVLAMLLWPVSALADAEDTRRNICLGWMLGGYPSGLEETACTAQFALPSPFLFKCIRAQRTGYDSDLQRRACTLYLADVSRQAANSRVRRQ
ncbi:hypothetical protein [uncultured Roseobacter sp.]|uniref:hypothetical protein n=1 Tax=uncultured Roseobacter sp. TaxID=114847 RepID=UPI0026208ED7|nr:hypothetical protein [uncultured Roseobacter sp.]